MQWYLTVLDRTDMLGKFTATVRDDSHAAASLRKMQRPDSFLDAPPLQITLVDTKNSLPPYKPIALKDKPTLRHPELPLAPRFNPTLLLERYKDFL